MTPKGKDSWRREKHSYSNGCGCQNQWVLILGSHFRTDFTGWIESDVHSGYDLDFDTWLNG